jgi:hypothetical protein
VPDTHESDSLVAEMSQEYQPWASASAVKLLLPQREEQFALSAKRVNNRVCVPYLYKSEADYLGATPDPYPEK